MLQCQIVPAMPKYAGVSLCARQQSSPQMRLSAVKIYRTTKESTKMINSLFFLVYSPSFTPTSSRFFPISVCSVDLELELSCCLAQPVCYLYLHHNSRYTIKYGTARLSSSQTSLGLKCVSTTYQKRQREKVRDVGGILTVTTTSQLFSIGNISKVQMFDIMGGRIETQIGSFCKLILRKAF